MHGDGVEVFEQARLETGFEKRQVDGRSRRAEDRFAGCGGADGFRCGERNRGILRSVGFRFPKAFVVRLVPQLPQVATFLKVRHCSRRPTRIRRAELLGASARGKRVFVAGFGVERVAVVENEKGADLELVERGDEAVVSRKVIFAFHLLRSAPCQVHPHPSKTGRREHFEFPRLRVGEMNVHPEAFRDDRRRQRRMRAGGPANAQADGEEDEEEQDALHGRVKAWRSYYA